MSIELVKSIEEYNLERFEKKMMHICSPLFKNSKITFFEYNKLFSDRSRVTLTTNIDWFYNFYNSGYYKNGMYHKDLITYKSGCDMWDCTGRFPIIEVAKENFKIDHGFTIIERSSNFCEFYHFGSCPGESNIINFYFNKLDMLKRFISYFKCEAKKILELSFKDRIKYIVNDERDVITQISTNTINEFFEETSFSRFYFNINDTQSYLTRQEMKVAQSLIQGKTAREIAIILNISSRTVESFMSAIKKKLGCYKQTQIVYKLLSIGLDKVINNNQG